MNKAVIILFILISMSAKAQFFNQNTDLVPPRVSLDEATLFNLAGETATCTPNKLGYVYFAKSSTGANITALEEAVTEGVGSKTEVTDPGQELELDVEDLAGGQYNAYLADYFERLSPVSTNAVTIVYVNKWNITVITQNENPASIGYVLVDGEVTMTETGGFYIQDATGAHNGIFVSDIEDVASVARGTNLEMLGEVEVNASADDRIEIKIDHVVEYLPNIFTINPAIVNQSTLDEDFRGVLIKIQDYDGSATNDSVTEMIQVTDTVWLYNRWHTRSYVGTVNDTITGIGESRQDTIMILPRDANDVIVN